LISTDSNDHSEKAPVSLLKSRPAIGVEPAGDAATMGDFFTPELTFYE
jgi:hypothetical protein